MLTAEVAGNAEKRAQGAQRREGGSPGDTVQFGSIKGILSSKGQC